MTWTATELTAIITAAIAAVGAAIVALISRKSETTKKAEPVVWPIVPERTPTKPTIAVVRLESNSHRKKIAPQIIEITHKEMAEHITRVPPVQRDSIEKHYIGLRVRWVVALTSYTEISNGEVMLHADTLPEKQTLECHARPEDVACLLHVPEGGEFLLEGTLDLVGIAFCILKDCSASLISQSE